MASAIARIDAQHARTSFLDQLSSKVFVSGFNEPRANYLLYHIGSVKAGSCIIVC